MFPHKTQAFNFTRKTKSGVCVLFKTPTYPTTNIGQPSSVLGKQEFESYFSRDVNPKQKTFLSCSLKHKNHSHGIAKSSKRANNLVPSLNRLSGCCGMNGFLLFHQEGTCGKVILKNRTVIVPIKKIKKNLLTKVPIIKGMTSYKIQKFTSTPSLYTRCARAFQLAVLSN